MIISFIIPVYNAERYIEECVNSILKQEKREFEFEVLLVDDGSTDGSANLCDKLAANSRVCVFHRANAGVSATRNFGISQAQGDFICFVDADDYLLPDSLDSIYRNISENTADYYVFPFIKEMQLNKLEEQRYSKQGEILDKEVACEFFFLDGKNGPWSKLFRKSIIEKYQIFFNESLKIHEDVIFCMDYLEHCKNVAYCSSPIYFYRFNVGGAVRKHKIEYLDNYNVVYKKWLEFLSKHKIEKYKEDLDSMFLYKYIITSAKLLKHGKLKKEIADVLNDNETYHKLTEQKYKNIYDIVLSKILKFSLFRLISLKVK